MSAVTFIAASSKYLSRRTYLLATALLALTLLSYDVKAAPNETAAVAPGLRVIGEDGRPVEPLSAPDVARYRSIFALQEEARWRDADQAIRVLDNRVLLGHVLYQRYVHPKFRSNYADLVSWLERYGDEPGAERIRHLALARMPAGAKSLPPEIGVTLPDIERPATSSPDDRLPPLSAAKAADNGHAVAQTPDWDAGLTAWQKGDPMTAAKRFEAMARSDRASSWDASAAAFWAARAYLRARHPERVNDMLGIAAQYPRTFYGLLASRQLGHDIVFNWTLHNDAMDRRRLAQTPGVRRAVALSQVGQDALAGQELYRLYMRAGDDVASQILQIASRINAPRAVMQLGQHWRAAHGETFDGALYPVPKWKPAGGFSVDRALIFAFMRQESAFDTKARSSVGATGLMQLMPQTASLIAHDRSLKGGNRLYSPEVNIELGQRYLQSLIEGEPVRGNLLLLAASYNAGPGKVKHWLADIGHEGDPLLFLEMMPSQQTRDFVERVVANFWIYELRLGQDTPSLDTLAGGKWPYYVAQDDATLSVADDEPE